jgi:hypothetical protein
MSNIWQEQTLIKEVADLYLAKDVTIPFLTNRDMVAGQYGASGGKTDVSIVEADTAAEPVTVGADITPTDVVTSKVSVDLDFYFAKSKKMNSLEALTNVRSFAAEIMIPTIDSIVQGMSKVMQRRIAGGFARYYTGTLGNNPSTLAHIAAAEKKIFGNTGAEQKNLVGLINDTTWSSLNQLSTNISLDYGPGQASNLAKNTISAMGGVNQWVRSYWGSQSAFDRGSITSAGIAVKGATTAGATSIVLDGWTVATGTIYEGYQFTIAGDATVYTTTADAVKAGSEVTVSFTPALAANAANDAVVTSSTAFTQNVIFDPACVAGVLLPPPPMDSTSIILGGADAPFQILMTKGNKSTLNGTNTVLFEVFGGCKVAQPKRGCVVQG